MHSDIPRDDVATAKCDRRRFFLRWFEYLITWRRRVVLRAKLETLDDHLLRDIGLTRDQITATAARYAQFPQGPICR